ncbi:MAG TPA: rhodanese-like domain-containing protein [Bryobacteraceae bacterium]|nr:rhodanese-like domain-containing protein [Bryobacteraceae bacterium]
MSQLPNLLPVEIQPLELKDLMDRGVAVRLIDVREPEEHAICRIEGARLIPMGSISQHLQELDREIQEDGPPLVIFCHHGVRSLSVVDWLRRQGLENCQSMAGGIDLWSRRIDPSVPRY